MDSTIPTLSVTALIKNGSYVAAFMLGLDYLNLTPISVEVLAWFIVADMITGILRTIVLHGGASFKSSIWERGLVAKSLIIFLPFGVALAGKGIGVDISYLAQNCLNVFILSELYSIIGNIYSIKTGSVKVEFDAIGWLYNGVKDLLKKFIKDDSSNFH